MLCRSFRYVLGPVRSASHLPHSSIFRRHHGKVLHHTISTKAYPQISQEEFKVVTIDSSFPKRVKQNTLAFFESFSQSAIFREGSNRLPWSMKWTDSTERTPTAKVCIQDPILRARNMSPLMVKYQSYTSPRTDLKCQSIEVESGPLVVPF